MPKGELFINGKDAYAEYGVSLTDAGLSVLMTPVGNKPPVENKSRMKDGKETDMTATKKDERTMSLPMHLTAPDKATFFARYAKFCEVLDGGTLEIRTKYQPTVLYRTYYISCQPFTEFIGEMAQFSLRLCEPNPKNRAL